MIKYIKDSSNSIYNSSIFRILYIIDLFLGSIALMEGFSLILRCILLPLGAMIIIHNYIYCEKFIRIKYYKILILFLISCFITTCIHYKSNLLPNLLFIFHFMVCFCIFFGSYVDTSFDDLKKEMVIISKFIIYFNAVLSLLGLAVAIIKVQVHINDYWIGMYNNRLIGLYTNSNLLALMSVLSLFLTHILFSLGKIKKHHMYIYILSAIISFISLILSDSNGSFMFLIIYITVMIFYKLFSLNKSFNIKFLFLNSVTLIFFCFTLSIFSFAVRAFCQENIATFINDTHKIEEPIYDNTLSDIPHTYEQDNTYEIDDSDNKDLQESVTIGRSMDNNSRDISSGRITLIKQAIFMFKKHPIMGIGRGNIVDYGAKYINGGLIFSDFHNGYLTILVSYGIIGFSIFIVFSFLVAVLMCKNLFRIQTPYPNLFAIIVGYSIYSLIEKALLSEITFMVVFFWLILGYAMSYIENYEHN